MNILFHINLLFILFFQGPPPCPGNSPCDPEVDALPINDHLIYGFIIGAALILLYWYLKRPVEQYKVKR